MSRLRHRRLTRREELLAVSVSARTVYTIGAQIERHATATPGATLEAARIAASMKRMWGALVRRSRFQRRGAS